MDISGHTVFIPGATSGIGLALALRLQAAGSTVIVGGRRTALLDTLETEHGLAVVQIDTADPDSIRAAAADVLPRTGPPLTGSSPPPRRPSPPTCSARSASSPPSSTSCAAGPRPRS